MDRGIKDEGFIRRALQIATNDNGRWIGNQSYFNGQAADQLDPKAHAALITAVAIFVENFGWSEDHIQRAIAATTCGEARTLVDELSPMIPSSQVE